MRDDSPDRAGPTPFERLWDATSWIELKTEDGTLKVRVARRFALCSHREVKDPLPCPVPSCPAGVGSRSRYPLGVTDESGRGAAVVLKRKLSPRGLWTWVSGI